MYKWFQVKNNLHTLWIVYTLTEPADQKSPSRKRSDLVSIAKINFHLNRHTNACSMFELEHIWTQKLPPPDCALKATDLEMSGLNQFYTEHLIRLLI